MKKIIIDRFEGIYAICENEDKSMFAIEKSELPKDIEEGTVILISDSGEIELDKNETQKRKNNIKNLQNKLFK